MEKNRQALHYHGNELYFDEVNLKTIAQAFGTPCYLYSLRALQQNWLAFDSAFNEVNHRICYSVKANSNIAVLNVFAKLNSGFDIVSGGELARVLAAGSDTAKIIFSGVGKSEIEIEYAIKHDIYCFNVESALELERLNTIASRLNKKINIAFRINPNIDAGTHSHIATGKSENKFGVDKNDILKLTEKLSSLPCLQLIGIASHIGSQITELKPFLLNLDCLLDVYKTLTTHGIHLKHINIGGGLGITYHEEKPPAIHDYAQALKEKIKTLPIEIILEPGRALVGNAGILLTKVEYLKHNTSKNFAIVDAGMNDFIRPALYDAVQDIFPVHVRNQEKVLYDIAGPVCESSDLLGKNRELSILPGDLLVVDAAGAYGFSMSSNYNSRCRPPEILVHGSQFFLIRKRETWDDLFAHESLSPETVSG